MPDPLRYALLAFLVYVIVGQILNWGSLIVVGTILSRRCEDNPERFVRLFRKHRGSAIGFDMYGWPEFMRTLVTQLLWPLNVRNTVVCGTGAIREAGRERRSIQEREDTVP